jgi:hypothetical protein
MEATGIFQSYWTLFATVLRESTSSLSDDTG